MSPHTKAAAQVDYARLGEMLLALSVSVTEDSYGPLWLTNPDVHAEDDEGEIIDGLDNSAESDVFELLAFHYISQAMDMSSTLRGPYNSIPRSKDFFSVCLSTNDRRFRHMFRVGRDTFDRLVELLADDPIFKSKGYKPQRHVKFQLACFLIRYGRRGSPTLSVAMELSIGEGTVFLYCKRVCRAIRQLRFRFLGWPNAERKQEIMDSIQETSGFSLCLGSIDGSLIKLTEEPPIPDGYQFQCRKKFFATNIQAIVDHERFFTSFEMGWPGSVPDVKMFKDSYWWKNRHAHVQGGQYILADKGYPSSPFVLRPFDDGEIGRADPADRGRMKRFNRALSNVRIASEHAYGMLKGRFLSLKEMGSHKNMQDVYKAIEAMMILHNIFLRWGDDPTKIWEYSPVDDFVGDEDLVEQIDADMIDVPDADIPEHESNEWLKQAGRYKRDIILNMLFPQ